MTQIIFDDEIFSQNIRYLRKKNHLSQKELALRSGMNGFWIRGIENGRYRAEIPAPDYWRLCSALNVKPDTIGVKYLP